MSENNYWFISHSTKNRSIVDTLVEILTDCGIPYWIAPEMIPRGSCYANEIPKAIRSCEVFLLVLSKESQESIYVQREVDMAIGYGKNVLTLKIDNSALSDMFHFWLNTVQMEQVELQSNGTLSREMKDNLKFLFLREIGKSAEFLKSTTTFEETKKVVKTDDRTNALRVNKIPMQCDYCGKALHQVSMGIYQCQQCGREYYDDFKKIRNFLEQNGPATAMDISRYTGVSMTTIRAYFSDKSKQRSVLSQSEFDISKKKDEWHFRHGENNLGYRNR